jgi:hypothetical protein
MHADRVKFCTKIAHCPPLHLVPNCQCHTTAILQLFIHDDETLGEDRHEGSPLTSAFQATLHAWDDAYPGEPYAIPGSGYIPPNFVHPTAARLANMEGYLGEPKVQALQLVVFGTPGMICAHQPDQRVRQCAMLGGPCKGAALRLHVVRSTARMLEVKGCFMINQSELQMPAYNSVNEARCMRPHTLQMQG